MTKIQNYDYNGFSFFECYSSKTGEPIVQVFRESTDKYGMLEEKLIDTLTGISVLRIAMMSDKEIDKLIDKYVYSAS